MRTAALLLALCLCGCSASSSITAVQPRLVVTLGDSVAAGTACGCDPFPDLYAHAQHAVSANLAEPGFTAADVLAQVPAAHAELAGADEVLLMIGANDLAWAFDDDEPFAGPAATVRTDVTATIEAIEAIHHTPVVVLGYWNVVLDGAVGAATYGPVGVREAARATDYANDALRAAARATGAGYLPTAAAFHGADGGQDPTGLLAADGDHPNARGHAAIAALLPPLSPWSAPAAGPARSGPG